MNLFRNLLFWLVLALAGALLAQMLLQDPGLVLVRFRGTDYSTTVAFAALMLVAGLALLWLLWQAVSLPYRAWHGRRDRKSRTRLLEGLSLLHQGHWTRAEKLLARQGCRITVAGDGFAALCSIEEARPDIIFMDAMMPRLDGFQTCALLRSSSARHRSTCRSPTASAHRTRSHRRRHGR